MFPEWMTGIRLRLRALFRRRQVERDLDDELAFHLAMREQKLVGEGMPPEEAHYAALRAFGNATRTKEANRELWTFHLLETLLQDLRYGLRQLRRNPGFTLVAVLTLALGIGANTAIFSIIDAVMLRTLPVRDADQLILLDWNAPKTPPGIIQSGYGNEFSYPIFEQFAGLKDIFSSVFGFASCGTLNVTIRNQASLAKAEMVTGTYFSGLGVQPMIGRAITREDEKSGSPRVAVISYPYWVRRFGRSHAALGQAITLNRVPFTIVGITPPQFFGVQRGYAPDLWIPVTEPGAIFPWGVRPGNREPLTDTDWWWIDVMGRLKGGVSQAHARARLDAVLLQNVAANLHKQPVASEIPHAEIVSASRGLSRLRGEFQQPLLTLMAIVGLVLLIACANLAGLFSARAAARRKEIAMRMALGASRLRLIRQLLTESIMLAAAGAAVGGIFAYWGTQALLLLASSGREPLALNVHADLAVLGFTAAVAVFAGLLSGTLPALSATGVRLAPALKAGPSTASRSAPRARLGLGKALVIAQVALCLILLVGAGLLTRTLRNLKGQDLGFNQHKLLLFGIDPTQDGYKGARLIDFYRQMSQRFRTLPGVESASLSFLTLIGDEHNASDIAIDGYTPPSGQKMNVDWNMVGPDFFKTMGIPLLLGRGIAGNDTASSARVVVINQAMAHRYFKDQDPIGHRILLPRSPVPQVEYKIIGVVGNAKYWSLRRDISPTAYFAYNQMDWVMKFAGAMHFEVRTAAAPDALIPAVHRLVHNFDPALPLFDVQTQVEQINESLMQERLLADVSSFFSLLALLLAGIGLYGLLAYNVARRTNEIGIRIALGARRGQVLWMVLRESLVLIAIGLAIGLPLTFALTRFLSSLLYGVTPTDPLTFIFVSLILIAVALAACYIPARRAAKVDPMVALRYE